MNYGTLIQDDTLQISHKGKILNITQIENPVGTYGHCMQFSISQPPPPKVLISFVEAPIKNCITVLLVKT